MPAENHLTLSPRHRRATSGQTTIVHVDGSQFRRRLMKALLSMVYVARIVAVGDPAKACRLVSDDDEFR